MFSQFDQRLAALEEQHKDVVSRLQESHFQVSCLRGEILELREENAKLRNGGDAMALLEDRYIEEFVSILKHVPKNSRDFFSVKSQKYYYRVIGDVPNSRYRNTLVPLGTFVGFVWFNHLGQQFHSKPVCGQQYCRKNCFCFSEHILFSLYPTPVLHPMENAETTGLCFSNEDLVLVFTDEPPALDSAPLHYYDYIQLINPDAFDGNGQPKFETGCFDLKFGDGVTIMGDKVSMSEQFKNSVIQSSNFVAKKSKKSI